MAFRYAKAILKNEQAEEAFNNAMAKVRDEWATEEADLAAAAALSGDPTPEPREFYNARSLERILDQVTEKIMGRDTLINQISYLKEMRKPKNLSAKEWTDRLQEINGCMIWMNDQNYKINQFTMNEDIIHKNLPLEWKVTFEKTQVAKKIARAMTPIDRPSFADITSEFEVLEREEITKKEAEQLTNKENNHSKNKNKEKGSQSKGKLNPCKKDGHDHQWKDCPDIP